jgi:SAM-dependent methyltransferase
MRRVINSVVDLDRLSSSLPGLAAWYRDRRAYMELPGAERLDWRASDPQVHDLTPRSPFDPHYFYQDVWAAQRVAEFAPKRHVDVGSRVDLVGFLTAITEVTFVDIRLLEAEVEGLSSVEGSVLEMPFPDRSLESVSCLHVAEHIGLGRYGDPLDPNGTVKAMEELQRVVAPGGQLLFAGPVGQRQVVFNAHRIQPPSSVIEIFDELELIEFSGTDDSGRFSRHRSPDEFENAGYALGLFLLRRPLVAS